MNGITGIAVWFTIQMWLGREDGPKWFLTFFLIPFVLVGAGLIYYTIHSFFGLFSPRARLRTSHTPVVLGESAELSWDFTGRTDKVRDLHLILEGRDERDEGSGKNRRTKTNVFYTANLIHLTNPNDLKSGTVLCPIPTDHLPTDTEGGERVIWVVRLKAAVEFGANLDDEYPLTVVASVPAGNALSS